MIRIYRSTDRSKPIFESSPNDIAPYTHALEKLKKFIHIQHADLVLNDIAKKADDVHLAGSHYQVAAQQLLVLVFKASGYDLEALKTAREVLRG